MLVYLSVLHVSDHDEILLYMFITLIVGTAFICLVDVLCYGIIRCVFLADCADIFFGHVSGSYTEFVSRLNTLEAHLRSGVPLLRSPYF